jgi:hypothetical protein
MTKETTIRAIGNSAGRVADGCLLRVQESAADERFAGAATP